MFHQPALFDPQPSAPRSVEPKGERALDPPTLTERIAVPVRDWMCDALMLIARRSASRKKCVGACAVWAVGCRPAVSDLVRAGLVHRHYQGFRVDHHNRGAHREAVCTIAEDARPALDAI